jgi:hypothetical protein
VENFKSKEEAAIVPPLEQTFVKQGGSNGTRTVQTQTCLLSGASDWNMLVDYMHSTYVFPDFIVTPQRPDVLIWSPSKKRFIMIELTCPMEENIEAATIRKQAKYMHLLDEGKNAKWSGHLLTIEVGARGYVALSTTRCLKKLGLPHAIRNHLLKTLSTVVAKCSYAIYLARNTKRWTKHTPLQQ